MVVYKFEVSGFGKFPPHMLSHTRCWPESDDDSLMLFDTARRTISMSSLLKPNKNVWASYGWTCSLVNPIDSDDYNVYHTWPC